MVLLAVMLSCASDPPVGGGGGTTSPDGGATTSTGDGGTTVVSDCDPVQTWSDPIETIAALPVDVSKPHLVDAVLHGDTLIMVGHDVNNDGSVWVFDVSEPSAPVQTGKAWTEQLMGVCHSGERAYALSANGNLLPIDVVDGEAVMGAASYAGGFGGRIGCDATSIAWGTGATGGVWGRLDDLPSKTHAIAGDVQDVEVEGERLWVLGKDLLTAYDIDGDSLIELGSVALDGSCYDLSAGEDWLVAACGSQGVTLVDRGDGQPVRLGGWSGHLSARTANVDGHHVLVAGWSDVVLLDAADPASPTLLATEAVPWSAMAVVPDDGQVAYVADFSEPVVLSWQDMTAPEIRASTSGAVAGATVLLTNDGGEVLCLDSATDGELGAEVLQPGEGTTWLLPDDLAEGATVGLVTNDPDETAFTLQSVSVNGVVVGDAAPDFTERDLDGNVWQLSALRGEVVFLGLLDAW